jgi:hypothetical protein
MEICCNYQTKQTNAFAGYGWGLVGELEAVANIKRWPPVTGHEYHAALEFFQQHVPPHPPTRKAVTAPLDRHNNDTARTIWNNQTNALNGI